MFQKTAIKLRNKLWHSFGKGLARFLYFYIFYFDSEISSSLFNSPATDVG